MTDVDTAAGDGDDEDEAEATKDDDWDSSELPAHLSLGSELTFSITVLEASGISTDCADVFCQFKYVSSLPQS